MQRKTWTIGSRLTLLALSNFIILLVVVLISHTNLQGVTGQLTRLGNVQLPAVRAMAMTDMIHDGLRAVVFRGFVAFYEKNDKEMMESQTEVDEFSRDIKGYLETIKSLDVSAETKVEVEKAFEGVHIYTRDAQTLIALLSKKDIDSALAAKPRFEESFEALEASLGALGERIEKETADGLKASSTKARDLGIGIAILGGILAILLPWFIRSRIVTTLIDIVRRLEAEKKELEAHTLALDASAEAVSQSAESQASAIEETASALEEINSMVQRTATNAGRLKTNSQESNEALEVGAASIRKMITEMDEITLSSGNVGQQVERSNAQIQGIIPLIHNIESKTQIINDIVFQTKLLSFNASVEAARAGEHGQGFSVVASEVGNLAHMSGGAAKDIGGLLEESIGAVEKIVDESRRGMSLLIDANLRKVDSGKRVAEHCGETFGKIAVQVQQVQVLSADISSAIDEQTRGLDEINRAIHLFNQTTQDNANSAKESSEVAAKLRRQFETLDVLMVELVSMVHAKKQSA